MNTDFNPNQQNGSENESGAPHINENQTLSGVYPQQDAPAQSAAQPQEDARTPYQTPVRSSADEQQQAPQDGAQGQSQPFQQNGPFQQGTASYNTYQQWQAQEAKHHAKKPHKPHGKKPAIIAGSVAAALVLFCGGMALGNANFGGSDNTSASASANLPTLSIASTPTSANESSKSSSGELSGEEIYAKLNASIVAIQSTDQSGQSSGSGVVMSEDGYIITNAHVITDENTSEVMSNISVLFSDGTQLDAKVVGTDSQTDLAVLKVEPTSKLTPAEFGNSDDLQVGENAYAIGSPGGVQLANSMTNGIISAINRDITVNDRVMSLIQTNVTINPGNSGGALINKYGQVVGITSAKLGISYYEGLGFAIPINSAKEVVDELIQNGYISGRPSIGITGSNVTEQMAQFRNLPQGVEIQSVDSRAKAASEGLQAGDVITAVNGTSITSMDDVNKIKGDMKAGEKLTLTIYRPSAQKSMNVTITLTDAHDLEGTDPAAQQQQSGSSNGNGGYYSYGNGYSNGYGYGNGNGNGGNGGSTYIDPFQYFFGN